MVLEGNTPPRGAGPLLAVPPRGVVALELVSDPVSSCAFLLLLNFRLYNPPIPRGLYIVFSSCFRFDLFLPDFILKSRATMSSSGSSKENSPADIINPYMNELKMHPKELLLKDGEV
jgi:hypothetical protein